MITLIIIFITLVCVYQTLAYRRMYRYVARELDKVVAPHHPKAAVILPCKGLDPDFKGNLNKLLTQDYGVTGSETGAGKNANFEIIFAVASIDDPAYPILSEVVKENPHIKCKLLVAGIDNRRAQKITNQLCALREVSSDVQVLVFVDSDVIAREDFLAQLVAPLQDLHVGIATGYRFYVTSQLFNLPGLIRSLWNRLSAWELSNKKFAFAWGGAMAIRRSVFEEAQVTKIWDRAADDDLSMTTAVKRLGLRVHFVPRCLVVSEGNASWSEVLEWTNRQLILTKVYYRDLWLIAIARAVLMAGWLVVTLSLIFQIIFLGLYKQIPVLSACSTLLIIELFFLFQAHRLWRQLLSQQGDTDAIEQIRFKRAYENLLWQSAIVLPVAHIVLPLITLYSLLTNRIRWRGVNYELRSAQETLVV